MNKLTVLVWHTIIAQTILPSPNASLDSPSQLCSQFIQIRQLSAKLFWLPSQSAHFIFIQPIATRSLPFRQDKIQEKPVLKQSYLLSDIRHGFLGLSRNRQYPSILVLTCFTHFASRFFRSLFTFMRLTQMFFMFFRECSHFYDIYYWSSNNAAISSLPASCLANGTVLESK